MWGSCFQEPRFLGAQHDAFDGELPQVADPPTHAELCVPPQVCPPAGGRTSTWLQEAQPGPAADGLSWEGGRKRGTVPVWERGEESSGSLLAIDSLHSLRTS